MTTLTVDPERAFADLAALVKFGPRIAGTEIEAAAAAFLKNQLDAAGAPAELRPFDTMLWDERAAALTLADGRQVPIAAVPFGGVTEGAQNFDLAVADGFGLEDRDWSAMSGDAWLVPRDAYRDYPDRALVEAAAPHGPGAFLFTASPGHRGGIPTVYYNFRDRTEAPAPPMATLSFDDALALVRDGVSRVRLQIDAEVSQATSQNVAGVLEGRTRPAEIVVVCAHVDSAAHSPGACDNAGGAACVTELARAAVAAGGFDRTVHFCVWGSHETGMHGSEAYIAEALKSGAQVVAAINYDLIGLTVAEDTLFTLGGPRWVEFAETAVHNSGIRPPSVFGPGYTDYTNFGAAGIASISLGQGHGAWNHTPGDDMERVSARGMRRPLVMGAAALAAAAGPDLPDLSGDFASQLKDEVCRFNARWGWSRFDAAP